MPKHSLKQIKEKITERSKATRDFYLENTFNPKNQPKMESLGCANLAHAYASVPEHLKMPLSSHKKKHFAIITAYNDMLSAHQPLKNYPDLIKKELQEHNAYASVASGVPAMCDGITQGYEGMELSLFSRDTIALSTAIGLSHNVFDGAFYLGVCDKIVPGLLIGALSFGNLAGIFVPSGPMSSGIENYKKAKARQDFAIGKISREELLKVEMQSYHSVGTCTFYGTANSNQMMMEFMGLHVANSSFINPNNPLRPVLVEESARKLASGKVLPLAKLIDERNILNALIGLMATGGSTNHTLHLIAIARACGIILNWDDFDAISNLTPLLVKVYPNGSADVNAFEASGGLAFVIKELLKNGLLFEDAHTIMDTEKEKGMQNYTKNPFLEDNHLVYKNAIENSLNTEILRPFYEPFATNGGLKILKGNLGRAVIKISAIKEEHRKIKAQAIVFRTQSEFLERFKSKELEKDFIAILPFQGPKSNGMPELHKLTTPLGALQDMGYKVALITDGRMSGASGKVPSAIHLSPEGALNGAILKIKDGDLIELDAPNNALNVLEKDFENREINPLFLETLKDLEKPSFGVGRELFTSLRLNVNSAEEGAMSFGIKI
ncbi:phosphogluconate dehydratase [Helicobacter cetorum]|uniref:Phosphogluconate dehydratase n=1 Tax=Helicobacter cetorum (strain ATCC BAA-429 / MIT 00-7128) TaxID=182217 RepID=I0EPI4_HELC0|nr:phosphogluconate dehydratase [Helicobacter cetorum]AFI04853.1 phosphogluconate dehydratase [Helicobacter cetorum MIT 00-7128]